MIITPTALSAIESEVRRLGGHRQMGATTNDPDLQRLIAELIFTHRKRSQVPPGMEVFEIAVDPLNQRLRRFYKPEAYDHCSYHVSTLDRNCIFNPLNYEGESVRKYGFMSFPEPCEARTVLSAIRQAHFLQPDWLLTAAVFDAISHAERSSLVAAFTGPLLQEPHDAREQYTMIVTLDKDNKRNLVSAAVQRPSQNWTCGTFAAGTQLLVEIVE